MARFMLEKLPAQKARVGDPDVMKPFAIAGIQMHLNHGSNVLAMRQRSLFDGAWGTVLLRPDTHKCTIEGPIS